MKSTPANSFLALISRYFDNSFSSLASFFAKESNMTAEELDVLLEETRRKLKNEKGKE